MKNLKEVTNRDGSKKYIVGRGEDTYDLWDRRRYVKSIKFYEGSGTILIEDHYYIKTIHTDINHWQFV